MNLHQLFKHLFIPHKGNDYKPHFFREISLIIILVISFFLFGVSAGSSFFIHRTILGASVVSSVLIDLTNENRLAYNETPLVKNEILEKAANLKAEDMVKHEYFAHNSPQGITPWHWFTEAGYKFLYAGENLAINFMESSDVEQAWLASPTHRANLLNVNFKEIGIATIEGLYEGNNTIFVVQMFGSPAKVSAQTRIVDTATTTSSMLLAKNENVATSSKISLIQKIKKATSTELSLISGVVEGANIEEIPTLQPVVTTNEFAVVENQSDTVTPIESKTILQTYSTWSDRLLFGGSRYVDKIYRGMIVFITFALFTMLVIEIKRQHWKHIFYGFVTLLTIISLLVINKGFF